MTKQDYNSKVLDFVDNYNKQCTSPSGYYRLRTQKIEHAIKLMPEVGNCIMWPEQIFNFARENGLLTLIAIEYIDNKETLVVTIITSVSVNA